VARALARRPTGNPQKREGANSSPGRGKIIVVTLSLCSGRSFLFLIIKNMSFEHSLKQGVFFGFVPHRLEIDERPELHVFPFNVLFAQYKAENGKTIMGSAIYEPDLGSFKKEEDKSFMYYHNAYGGKSWLLIEFDSIKKSYLGKKVVDGKDAGMATGMEWNMFFAHFTALGLTNGERCKFEEIG